MAYSDIYLRSRSKTPALLYVLAFIAVGGFIATFLKPSTPSVRASKEKIVYHTLANVSTHQAGVYYQTTTPTKSWVIYGSNPQSLDRVAFDDRDTEVTKGDYNLHFVLLKDLQENTTYSYKIIADDAIASINSNDTFSFKTPSAQPITNNDSINPAYGKVVQQNSDPVNDGFVIYYYPEAYPLVAPIRGGDWIISLTSLIDRNTGKMIFPKTTETVKIEMLNEALKSTSFETVLGNTTPLSKTVVIGKPYAENGSDTVLSAHVEVKVSPTAPVQTTTQSAIDITFPKENAIIPGNNPLIKGKALTNTTLSVILRNARQTIFSTKITADSQGDWKVALPMPLQPATYTLTMSTKDSSDRAVTLSRKFTTTKSGEEVLGTATGEATITPTSVLPSPTQPIAQISPTAAYATPTTAVVSTTPPVTGENNGLIIAGSLALVIIAAGVIILL